MEIVLKKIGKCICEALNNNKKLVLFDSVDIEDIFFESEINSYKKDVTFEKIVLENEVNTQCIKLTIIGNYEKNKVRIWLDNNSVSTKYLTNSGLSITGAKFIMKVIADLKQEKMYLVYGRQKEFTFEPGDKNKVESEYYKYIFNE